jgi:hypothetical protein
MNNESVKSFVRMAQDCIVRAEDQHFQGDYAARQLEKAANYLHQAKDACLIVPKE